MTLYRLTSDAARDLDRIARYLRREGGVPAAVHVMEKVEAAFRMIGARPGIGHSRIDLTSAPVKFWQVFSYLIVYDPAPSPIEITRVLHASRDIARLL